MIEAGAYVGQFVGVHGFAGGIVIGRVYLRIANPTGAGAATSRSGTLSQRLGTVAALLYPYDRLLLDRPVYHHYYLNIAL